MVAKVVIGVDPHKRINAVVVLNSREGSGAPAVRERRAGVPGAAAVQSAVAAANVGDRGLQRGRQARRAAARRRRVNGSWMSRHGVPRWCACSRAGTAARTTTPTRTRSRWSVCTRRTLPEVRADDRRTALRLLSNRRRELIGQRTQCVNRLHRDLVGLVAGGAPKR